MVTWRPGSTIYIVAFHLLDHNDEQLAGTNRHETYQLTTILWFGWACPLLNLLTEWQPDHTRNGPRGPCNVAVSELFLITGKVHRILRVVIAPPGCCLVKSFNGERKVHRCCNGENLFLPWSDTAFRGTFGQGSVSFMTMESGRRVADLIRIETSILPTDWGFTYPFWKLLRS